MSITTFNDTGIEVLGTSYLRKLMGKDVNPPEVDPFNLILIEAEFEKYGISLDNKPAPYALDEFWTPDLLGSNINEHYEKLAVDLIDDALKIIKSHLEVINAEKVEYDGDLLARYAVPHTAEKPWLKLSMENHQLVVSYVEVPDSKIIVLDFETFVNGSRTNMPIIGTAVGYDGTTSCLYLWTHASLLDPTIPYEPVLCSIGTGKVVIAHNIGFDGQKVKERYTMEQFVNYYLCTMSMHTAVAGFDASQRWATNLGEDDVKPSFLRYGSAKNLKDAYTFHTGKKLPDDAKDPRKIFVKAKEISEITEVLPISLAYAMKDVVLTWELFTHLWPKYKEIIPSTVALAGHMLVAESILSVRTDWYDWCQRVETAWLNANEEIKDILSEIADSYVKMWQTGELNPEEDHWLKHLDWSRLSTDVHSPLYNYPKWYIERLGGGKLKLSGRSDIASYLLKLCWKGHPLSKNKELAWHYIEDGQAKRIPHPKKEGNVGSCLSATCLRYFEEGWLHSQNAEIDERAKRIVTLMQLSSYWTGMRTRVLGIHAEAYECPISGEKMLLVAPGVVPHGTVSGRTVDPIWVVLAHWTAPKYGSEIKACTRVDRRFWSYVGYDLDSQELRIVRLYGDSLYKFSGSTPFGVSEITGDKKNGTDFHSLVGVKAGVHRDPAKQVVYLTFYGGGKNSAQTTLLNWCPDLDPTYALTKGQEIINEIKGKKINDHKFAGGIASASFNAMYGMVLASRPCTPVLGSAPALPVWPANNGQGVYPGLLNWAVQSAGSTFGQLSCALVGIAWLYKRYGIRGRVAAACHDEFQTLVEARKAIPAAYLMQINHAWLWALTHYNCGVYDLPVNTLFASAVNVDMTWRKDAQYDCKTPTFPEGYPPGKEYAMPDLIRLGKQNNYWGFSD